ncbi:hypothetical protein [Hyunsoonleella aestuarii]|nr:hypothetical protein [Hyunsoonleella aestuarii]
MLKIKLLLLLFSLSSLISKGQENHLKKFEALVGKVWYAEGNWANGSKFKQEITFQFSLDSTIVLVNSNGYTDINQTKYGLRNHGIRQYDKTSKKIKFWEFDIFGELTTGSVEILKDDIFYTYKYGNAIVTDAWIKIDDKTYKFIVGSRSDGKWTQKYLETKFRDSEK